ncbi:hypothetical protein MPER_03447, partial [Moniliophthora perniciosa FA553]
AKDDIGITHLFNHLIKAIIDRRDTIEKENELKKRDSVFLSTPAPTWAAQAEEEEAREKERQAARAYGAQVLPKTTCMVAPSHLVKRSLRTQFIWKGLKRRHPTKAEPCTVYTPAVVCRRKMKNFSEEAGFERM